MTSRALAWLLLTPWCLPGQLRVFVVEDQQERLIQGSLDLGAVETGDRREAACRVRNAGVAPVRLETLQVAGVGFGLAASLTLPKSLEPGGALDFSVHFEAQAPGSYSAVLWLNSQSVLLRVVALPAPVVFLERDGERFVLKSPSTIDFDSIEQGLSATRRFLLENQTNARLEVPVAVTGACFRAAPGLRFPLTLAPGETVAFEVTFEPQQAGIETGLLEISRRSFRLQGTGMAPPFPKPEIILRPQPTGSGQQIWLAIGLASAPRLDGSGRVRLDFRSELAGVSDDAAIKFMHNGQRTAVFLVRQGREAPDFHGLPDIAFQTGTTAGSIILTAELGGHLAETTVAMPHLPVVIYSARATRTASSVEVDLTGFDNTRSASQIAFSFFDAAGQPVSPGRISFDAAGEFGKYFESSTLGGTFALRAGFPVSGDASLLAWVEIEITSSVGVTSTGRVPITP